MDFFKISIVGLVVFQNKTKSEVMGQNVIVSNSHQKSINFKAYPNNGPGVNIFRTYIHAYIHPGKGPPYIS